MNIILYSKSYRSITNRCILSFGALPKNELKENSIKNTKIPSQRDRRKQLLRNREPLKVL